MAEKKKRVHHLAKELLVTSKTIIEKCRAEGIELKNHMHVVSAGLEATIREWFSEGAHTTTLEESERIVLTAVRVKPKRKKKVATPAAPAEAETTPAAQESEAEVAAKKEEAPETPAPTSPQPVTEEPPVKVAAEVAVEGVEPLAPEAPAEPIAGEPALPAPALGDEMPPAVAAQAPEPPAAEPAEPPEPMAAGPQNIPRPAQLAGPKVIRIERPDSVVRPRPSPRPSARPPGVRPPTRPEEDDKEPARRERGGHGSPRGRDGEAAATPGKHVHPRRTNRDSRDVVNEKFREWRDRDLIERRERLDHASGRGIGGLRAIEGKQPSRGSRHRAPQLFIKKDKVEMTEPLTIKGVSRETGIPANEIVKHLMGEGLLVGVNSGIESDKAQLICADHGIELTVVKTRSGMDRLAEEFALIERHHLEPRPPVVTVLGHVDHGKTSLLDRIRKTSVAKGEAGGITQHMGAYRVRVGDRWVTFLDTPGHAAFTAMRARGANLTDVVVLVVAADDGVMPTTVEAINHARAADTTIVVALNKIDLPHDINELYGQLAGHGLTPTGEWGGETDVIRTSATTGEGLSDLLSHLATLSDLMELTADPTVPASGRVIEAERSGSLGNVARVLVQDGTLSKGDVLVCGGAYGRVRALRDDTGASIKKAGPSTPVEVTGLSTVPEAGDRFFVLDDIQRAKDIATEILALRREKELIRVAKPTNLESVLANTAEGEIPELNVIIRADVQGSVDVLKQELTAFPSDQVKLAVVHAGVGVVTESDVMLAQASRAIIIAFHVVPDPAVKRMAEDAGVDVRSYRVIYNVIDDVRKALEGLLTPEEKAELRGRVEVREIFNISRVGRIAGCFVRDGLVSRDHRVRIVRDGVVVRDESTIASLKRFKDDVKEVKGGFECGIRIDGFNDVKPGDIIESFEIIKVAKTLDV